MIASAADRDCNPISSVSSPGFPAHSEDGSGEGRKLKTISDNPAMAEAFARAGYESPADQLNRLMRESMVEGVGIQPRVLALFERAMEAANSATLERLLVGEEARRWAAIRLFNKIRDALRREQAGGRDQRHFAGDDAGQALHVAVATPTTTSPRDAAVVEIATLSLLRRFRINGKPIGEATAGEARTWLRKHERDGRWVRLILDGLSDDMLIGDYVKDDEANRLYRLATGADNE
jgi:hypothetical protein